MDVFVGSHSEQYEQLVLDGEGDPYSETHSGLPDSAAVKLPDAESRMEMRFSDHLRKGEHGFQNRGVEVLGKRPEVPLETLGECDPHPRRPRPMRFPRGYAFFSRVPLRR